jgi:hypothetical protein
MGWKAVCPTFFGRHERLREPTARGAASLDDAAKSRSMAARGPVDATPPDLQQTTDGIIYLVPQWVGGRVLNNTNTSRTLGQQPPDTGVEAWNRAFRGVWLLTLVRKS